MNEQSNNKTGGILAIVLMQSQLTAIAFTVVFEKGNILCKYSIPIRSITVVDVVCAAKLGSHISD